MNIHYEKGNLFSVCADPRFWSTGDLFFRHFYILPWNNGSIPWNNMDQFFTDNFIVIQNFMPWKSDFSDVSSFSRYAEISRTGVRFSSPPPAKTAWNGGFIVSRETFWNNDGTMLFFDRYRYFVMCQWHKIATESTRNRRTKIWSKLTTNPLQIQKQPFII